MNNKLAVFSLDGEYYSIVVWDLEKDSLITAQINLDIYKLFNIIEEDWIVTFENNDPKLARLIVANIHDDRILKSVNTFEKTVKGVCFTSIVKSYGYNINLVKSIESASNICQYLIVKNKGL